MDRIEALQLIEKNRTIINSDAARMNEKLNAEAKAAVNEMKKRLSDIIETARLCEAGEHHSLKKIKRFKSTRSPGFEFTTDNDALLYLADIDDRLIVMRIDKDGNYRFFFSGAKRTDPKPDIVQETDVIRGFLKRYDRFEKRFYSFVDKRLRKETAHLIYLKNKFNALNANLSAEETN